jgi:probable aminopeptidase NPEPL1
MCSRDNTPSRAHLLTKFIRGHQFGHRQLIVVACERRNAVACACAVARAFSLYSAKTSGGAAASQRHVHVSFVFVDASAAQPTADEVECYGVLGRAVRLTARLVETPCADMTTSHFAAEVGLVAAELGLEPLVIEGEELSAQGFGGLYNVGKAAVSAPRLVVLSHVRPAAARTVAWVGKGIVYDTGGLCIKSRAHMCSMKVDCGGAAGILGAFYAAVKLGFQDNLHAVFCLAENAVAGNAYRPDDIIKLYSGK